MDSEGGGLEFQRSKVRDDVRVTQTSGAIEQKVAMCQW